MATYQVKFSIQDMSWEKCVSRVERTLEALDGVLEVQAKLLSDKLGEAEILCNPERITVERVQDAISEASGPRHNFIVASVDEPTSKAWVMIWRASTNARSICEPDRGRSHLPL